MAGVEPDVLAAIAAEWLLSAATGSAVMNFFRARSLRFFVSVLLLVLIAWIIDLRAALALVKEADWRWVVLCLVVIQVQIVLSAMRWQMTARALGQKLSLRRAIGEYYLATLGNLSLPGGVTGDAARVYRHRHLAGGATVSAQAVLIERLAGQVALFVVAFSGWLLWPVFRQDTAPDRVWQLFVAMLGMLIVALLMVIMARYLRRRVDSGSEVCGRGRALVLFLGTLGPALQRSWISERRWLAQGVLSLAVVATYLMVFAGCAQALQQEMPLVGVLLIVPLVLLSMVVPISIGGWGVREAVAAALWPMLGLSAEAGVASSVLYGLLSTLGALPGAIGALWSTQRD